MLLNCESNGDPGNMTPSEVSKNPAYCEIMDYDTKMSFRAMLVEHTATGTMWECCYEGDRGEEVVVQPWYEVWEI